MNMRHISRLVPMDPISSGDGNVSVRVIRVTLDLKILDKVTGHLLRALHNRFSVRAVEYN